MRRKAGLTLIELVSVFAIITVLTGMMFPVLSHVREIGRQSICMSNLRQIGLAASLYAQDYEETLVPAGLRYAHQPLPCYECNNDPACMTSSYWSRPRAWVDWGPALQTYLKKTENVFKAPERPDWGCWGYAMNTDSSDDDFMGPPTPPGAFVEDGVPAVPLAQVVTPAECLFLFDSFDVVLEDAPSTTLPGSQGPDTEAWETMNAWVQAERAGLNVQRAAEKAGVTSPWRHSGAFNVFWLDGHVGWKHFSQLDQHNLDIQNQDYGVLE